MTTGAPPGQPVALITGGARRLGRAIALALAARGVRIALHRFTSDKAARATQRDIEKCGVECRLFQADLGRSQLAAGLPGRVVKALGRLDILVNSASLFYDTPLGGASEKQLDVLLQVNLKSPYRLMEAAAPHLKATRGCIINLLDEGALRPWKSHGLYIASKAGLAALTVSMAKALAPEVRVNGIAPGAVLLPEGTSRAEARRQADATLLGRIGSAESIARAAVFLALDADYTTGEILHVDGGRRWTGMGAGGR